MTLKAITFLGNPPKTKERPFGYDEKRYLGPGGAPYISHYVGAARSSPRRSSRWTPAPR